MMTDSSHPAPDPAPTPPGQEPPLPASFERPKDVTQVLRRSAEAPAPGARRVLVVDDAAYLRRILSYHLVKGGFVAVEAENGEEALRLLRSQPFDAVLLDLAMPVMDGFAACKAIKEDPALRDIPVIICTARSEKESVVRCLSQGADDYVVKPYEKTVIFEKLKRYMKRSRPTTIMKAESAERRTNERAPVALTLTHVRSPDSDVPLVYRVPILNLSLEGCCFEFALCPPCPGYSKGTVHPLCVFYPYAMANAGGKTVDLLIGLPDQDHTILEIKGRIVHVFRPESSEKELVGVKFTDLSEQHKSVLRQFISETKRRPRPAAV